MIYALMKRVSVTINVMKCTGEQGATARVLISIKKWTPSY
jgi:hypothetical protein